KVSQALTARRDVLKSAGLDARLASETIDVTLPVREASAEAGRIHPLSQVFEEVNTIFADMGFSIAEGPDIETDDYNFTKLNFPEGHPAREMHDTFFFNPKEDGSRMLLRTHTSPVQVRTMLTQKPPIRVICPGRTYRVAMLKYGMSDLRQLFESDVRWLNHYGFKPLEIPTLAGGLSS